MSCYSCGNPIISDERGNGLYYDYEKWNISPRRPLICDDLHFTTRNLWFNSFFVNSNPLSQYRIKCRWCWDNISFLLFHEKKVWIVMVNNFTNINNINSHLSPQIIENRKGPWHMTLEIQVFGHEILMVYFIFVFTCV